MFTDFTPSTNPSCCKCAQVIESETKGLCVDEHSMICDECYRAMLAADQRSPRMECLD